MQPAVGGATRVGAVIGCPVRHSLSPTLYNAAFAAAGLDWVYTAFEVAPGRAADALAAMRTLGLGTLAVTMPHKDDVFAAVDAVEPEAQALRTVNCVVPLPDGRLLGASTDGIGFVDSLRADAGTNPAGAHVVVLGAGGAARSIIDAVGRAGANRITVVNRTQSKAEAAAALAAVGVVGTAADVALADIVVNTTSVGMRAAADSGDPADHPCDPNLLRAGQLVADIVYQPLRTAWLSAAATRGAATHDGLGMLVHQAVHQYRRFVGTDPDPVIMREAALAELDRRAAAANAAAVRPG